jgi:bisphosphoglycerate-independent phosphoglycerate mutase (AlkP superfamily)
MGSASKLGRDRPLVLVVMDGVGVGSGDAFDEVALANTPMLDRLAAGSYRTLRAHGTAVGLPSDADMGNSEVGHNILGAGRIFDQGAKRIDKAVASGAIWKSEAWSRSSTCVPRRRDAAPDRPAVGRQRALEHQPPVRDPAPGRR